MSFIKRLLRPRDYPLFEMLVAVLPADMQKKARRAMKWESGTVELICRCPNEAIHSTVVGMVRKLSLPSFAWFNTEGGSLYARVYLDDLALKLVIKSLRMAGAQVTCQLHGQCMTLDPIPSGNDAP